VNMTIRWDRFAFVCPVCEPDVDDLSTFHRKWASAGKDRPCGRCQRSRGKTFWTLRGDVPNPRQIDASELHKLPRAEIGTDPHDPTKGIVYSGTPLMEVLKAGGLLLDSGMAGIRQTVTMTVLVEATDGLRAVLSLPELDPELTDRVILLADIKDGQRLPRREGTTQTGIERQRASSAHGIWGYAAAFRAPRRHFAVCFGAPGLRSDHRALPLEHRPAVDSNMESLNGSEWVPRPERFV
jgi:hypothetical protein